MSAALNGGLPGIRRLRDPQQLTWFAGEHHEPKYQEVENLDWGCPQFGHPISENTAMCPAYKAPAQGFSRVYQNMAKHTHTASMEPHLRCFKSTRNTSKQQQRL